MNEPVISPAVAPVASATPPAEASPAVSSVVEASAAPSPVVTESSAPAPVVAETKTDAKIEATNPLKNSLLDESPVKTDTSVDAKAPETTKEPGDQIEKTQLPSYDAFKLPEGMTYDQEKLSDFTNILGEFQSLTKADQAATQAFGQKLIDRHVAELQKAVQSVSELTKTQKETQVDEWDKAFRSDPEIGGKKQDTTLNAAKAAIATLGGNAAQQAEFRTLLKETGAYAHPAMIRTLANMQSKIEAYKAQIAKYTTEDGVKPLLASKPEPTPTKSWEKRYK
jgi:hypothetical protein